MMDDIVILSHFFSIKNKKIIIAFLRIIIKRCTTALSSWGMEKIVPSIHGTDHTYSKTPRMRTPYLRKTLLCVKNPHALTTL